MVSGTKPAGYVARKTMAGASGLVGDVASAAQFVHSERRLVYRSAWSQLPMDIISAVDQIMTEVRLVEVGPGAAQYDMRRDESGQTFSYPIWFQLDQDGLWRLLRF